METRKLTQPELKKVQAFFNVNYGIEEELSSLIDRCTLIKDYISDCPGYSGDLIFIIWAIPEYHHLLKFDDKGNLQEVIKED